MRIKKLIIGMLIAVQSVILMAQAQVNVSFNIAIPGASVSSSMSFQEVTDQYYIIGVPLETKTKGLVLVLEPAEALVEIYAIYGGGTRTLILKDYTPTAVELNFSGDYEILVTYGNYTWRKTINLRTGMKYVIGVTNIVAVGTTPVVGTSPVAEPEPTPPPPPPAPAEPAPPACPLMDPSEFASFINQMEEASFSDDKMRILSTAAKTHCFTVDQAIQIANVFSFDDDKLQAMKIVYHSLIDPTDVHKLYSVFKFSSTAEEFERWVNSQ